MEENETPHSSQPQKKKIKRYCTFIPEWEDMFEHIKKVDAEHGMCKLCSAHFTVKFEGKRAVENHCNSQKHKNNIRDLKSSKSLRTFFVKKFTKEEDEVTLIEIVNTYHSVRHQISYNAQDCHNKLLPKLITDSKILLKISCGRTKAASIVEGVLAPKSQECLLDNLKKSIYYSVASDALNRGNIKLFSLCVQFFSRSGGIVRGVLDFYEDSNETSEAIANQIIEKLQNNNLDFKHVTSYSGDNASVNFGGRCSVFQKLKAINSKLIASNCKCHILHNQ